MDNDFFLLEGKEELLEEIQELWQKLNEHHLESTIYFKKKFKEFNFENRKKALLEKALTGSMQVLIAKDRTSDAKVGYCVSTVTAECVGELDSIFVEKEFRRLGAGDMLMSAALKWLEEKAPKEVILTVSGGNEKVLDFYKRYGFYTNSIKLAKVEGDVNNHTANYKNYIISAEKAMLKLDDVAAMLNNSYWAADRSREKIVKSIENSLCFGVYDKEKQIGFARVITDYATNAYICDVIIDESYRGQGLGKAFVAYIMEFPELQEVNTFSLMTRDAQTLYEKYGFSNMENPQKFMMKRGKSK